MFESLAFFNLGIEAGQLMIIGVTIPAILWLYRHTWKRRAAMALSAGALAAAVMLLADRIAFPDG